MAAALLLCAPMAVNAQALDDQPPVALDVAPAAPAPAGAVGPRELSNFSLDGRVTREAEPTAVARPSPPVEQADLSASEDGEAVTSVARSAQERASRQPEVAQRPRLDPLSRQPTLAGPADGSVTPPSPLGTGPDFVPDSSPAADFAPAGGGGQLDWLYWLAGLAAAAIAVFAVWQKLLSGGVGFRLRPAGMPGEFFDLPEPDPVPAPPLPRKPAGDGHVTTRLKAPSPAPVPPVRRVPASEPESASEPKPAAGSGGIVSTRLRPWLDLDLVPDRLVLTDDGAVFHFDCVVQNSGSVPAREIRIEAAMINAGEQQDQEIAGVFARPPAGGAAIPQVPPMSTISLKTSVEVPAAAIRAYEVEGRKLFIPVAVFNTHYQWSSGSGHSGASFLVGRDNGPEARMAPFRVDRGPRVYQGLGQRRHTAGLRA